MSPSPPAMQAYYCLRCPSEPFHYSPFDCASCDYPMVPLAAASEQAPPVSL